MFNAVNVALGSVGECVVRDAFVKLGFSVVEHDVFEKGLDVDASKCGFRVVGEVINWHGGFIHPERFGSILGNLFSVVADRRFLFCFGVDCSSVQKRLLCGYGVTVVHCGMAFESLKDCFVVSVVEALTKGVITYVSVVSVSAVLFASTFVSGVFCGLEAWFLRQRFRVCSGLGRFLSFLGSGSYGGVVCEA